MRLAAHGLSARAVELNEAGARLATGVRDREFPGRWVAGDIGPCGAMVAPMGTADPADLRATFAEQARALVHGGVDLLNIETMFDLTEATIAVEEAVKAAEGRPVLASMAFKPAAKGFRTMMGVTPEQAVAALKAAGADVVGCNCEISLRAHGRPGAACSPGSPAASPTRSPTPASRGWRPERPCTTRRRSTSPPSSPRTRPWARSSSAGAAARRPPPSPRSPRPWAASAAASAAPPHRAGQSGARNDSSNCMSSTGAPSSSTNATSAQSEGLLGSMMISRHCEFGSQVVDLEGDVGNGLDDIRQRAAGVVAHPLDAEAAALVVRAVQTVALEVDLAGPGRVGRDPDVVVAPHSAAQVAPHADERRLDPRHPEPETLVEARARGFAERTERTIGEALVAPCSMTIPITAVPIPRPCSEGVTSRSWT